MQRYSSPVGIPGLQIKQRLHAPRSASCYLLQSRHCVGCRSESLPPSFTRVLFLSSSITFMEVLLLELFLMKMSLLSWRISYSSFSTTFFFSYSISSSFFFTNQL
ncbi:unnamed protein product [Amoebophrya sp. A120]|nr:unnamed protein product [Amoebophrya sp. A120]|eukprot:GSA120T00000086001.1